MNFARRVRAPVWHHYPPMQERILVREEQPADHAAIRRVIAQAFGSATEADLVDALRAAGAASLSLVAERADEIVGHVLFSPVVPEAAPPACVMLGLGPLAVLPEFQRHSIGGRLVHTGLEKLRQRGVAGVVVMGQPEYYPRFGFVPASRLGLSFGVASRETAFFALELRLGALASCRGVVRYRPEFAGL
jgi:putative acetyltransferase